MRKIAVILPLILGAAAVAMAGGPYPPPVCTPVTPEINVASGAAALVLVAGAVLVIRGRRKA